MATNGPNQILPANSEITTNPEEPVILRIPKYGKASETIPPISIPGLLQDIAKNYPNHAALCHKVDGKWVTLTYREYLEKVRTCAKAFLKLGLERHHSVCILGFNSVEWFLSDLAAIFAGGIACGIYTTNSSEACFYCIDNSRANIVVVENEKQLEKIIAVKSRLKNVKAIIQYEGNANHPNVLSWNELMNIGRDVDDNVLDNVLKTIGINECCTLVYTSGTVGQPKGVMLNHDNLTWDALMISERIDAKKGEEHLVSYLPLSHVAAQIVDIYLVMANASCIHFADKNALKGTLIETLKEVQPTKFLAVPRVWEKMYEKMQQIAAQNGYIKSSIASWAKKQALDYHLNKIKGMETNSWGYFVASSFIFKKIKQALGLTRCSLFASAAAPLASDVKRYFLSIDIPIMEAFGMSEVSGAHTLCHYGAFGLDTIGTPLPGVQTKIDKPDENGQGEICLKGRHVFMGYLNQPEKTYETIDKNGWVHTGDLGYIDKRNFVYITGRLKELLITAGGENIPPVPIEQLVKAELPYISNAVLIGDKRKFLSILLTFKTEIDSETGKPLDDLLPFVQEWLAELGCPAKTVSEVLNAGPDKKLLNALKEAIDRVNQQAVSNAQRIQKLTIVPADFSIPTGELGPTMKIKRNVVLNKYAHLIDKMYE